MFLCHVLETENNSELQTRGSKSTPQAPVVPLPFFPAVNSENVDRLGERQYRRSSGLTQT